MLRKVIAVFALAALALGTVCAFSFSPLEQVFAPKGSDSTKIYTIINDSDDAVAIMLKALVRDQKQNGDEVNTDASRYFSIVPNKLIVNPRGTQIVRVQYKGPQTVTTELSFRLRAEQVPYSQGRQPTNQNMFNFLYIYTTSLYVSPSRTVERFAVPKAAHTVSPEGDDLLELTLVNSGNVHKILSGIEISVTDPAGRTVVLSGSEALPGIDGTNILAKKKLVKTVPWPEGLKVLPGVYKTSVSFGK